MTILIKLILALGAAVHHSECIATVHTILKIPQMQRFIDAFRENGTYQMALQTMDSIDVMITFLNAVLPKKENPLLVRVIMNLVSAISK